MGWSGGSLLAEDILSIVLPNVSEDKQEHIIREIIESFEAEDCDTMEELRYSNLVDEYPILETVVSEMMEEASEEEDE